MNSHCIFFFLPSFQSFRKYECFPCAEALCQLPKKSRGGRKWRALVCDLQSLVGRDQRRKGCEAHYKWALLCRSPENHCLPGHITRDPKEKRRHHLTFTIDSLGNEQSLLNQKFNFFSPKSQFFFWSYWLLMEQNNRLPYDIFIRTHNGVSPNPPNYPHLFPSPLSGLSSSVFLNE